MSRKKIKKPEEPRIVETNDVPQRYYVNFRSGVLMDETSEESELLIDQFLSDLSSEMGLAVKRTLKGYLNDDGTKKYASLEVLSEMKISHEMVDWIQL